MCYGIPSFGPVSPPPRPHPGGAGGSGAAARRGRGRALPSDVTLFQVALAWNAMEVGLGLERLTQPQDVDVELARRTGWLLLDAVWRRHRPPATTANAGSEYPMNTTQIRYQRRHVADLAAALRLARAQMSREQGPRAELARHQQQRLEVVVRHAATHSPFYRRQFAETGALGDGPVQLVRLPVLDKSLLMEHFDELVCDPRLRRDELFDCVGRTTRDQLYLDRYRVMLTSGSSGRPGVFVYDATGWRSIGSGLARSTTSSGSRPTLPRQRLAFVGAAEPYHISRQAATLGSGLHRVLLLPVTLPLPRLVEALDQFQPTRLQAYSSRPCWLVDEQHAGRLRCRHGFWSLSRSCARPR